MGRKKQGKADYKGYSKPRDRKGWIIQWTDEHGKRKRKTVDVETESEAKARWAAEVARVAEIREKGFTQTPVVETFTEFSKEFLRHQKNRIADKVSKGRLSQAEYDRQEGIVEKHLIPHFGAMQMANVRRADVIDYVNRRMGDVSDGTILKERNVLRRLFNLAVEKEKMFQNPAAGPALRSHLPSQPEGRVRYLSKDEWRAVIAACAIEPTADDLEPVQWLQQFVALSLSLGTRRGELMAVTVGDIDFQRGVVNLKKTKTGKSRDVPLNDLARSVLASMEIEKRPKKSVLWPMVTPEQVSMKFIRACRAAGVEDFSLHDLRHTAASWLRMKGADLHDVQAFLGHADPRMTTRYAHLSPAHLADTASKLDGLFALPAPE